MTPSNAVLLARIRRERLARSDRRSAAELDAARADALTGNPEPYLRLQWPTVRWEPWQLDAIQAICDPKIRIVALKGATGVGKNLVGGIACCLFYDLHHDARIRITRDTYDNAVAMAFGEVAKWWRRMRYRPSGQLLRAGADDGPERWMQCVNPRSEEGFHGVHSGHVKYWFDEATAPNLANRFEAAMTQAHKVLASANPRTMSGWFRDLYPRDNPNENQTVVTHHGVARLITISQTDCTNVRERCLSKPVGPIGGITIEGTHYRHGDLIPQDHYRLKKPIIPGQTCYDEAQVYLTHPDPFQRNVMGMGQFPEEDPAKQVILGTWVDRAVARWQWADSLLRAAENRPEAFRQWLADRLLPVQCFGLDVAASAHGDETVLAAGGRLGVRKLHTCQFRDTQQTVAWVLETASSLGIDLTRGAVPVAIDYGGGYGNAVGDPLRARGVRVVEVHGGAAPEVESKRYGNRRAELYGEFGRRLDPAGDFAESPYAVPGDSMLRAELVVPQKVFAGQDGQKFYLTPKTRKGSSQNFSGRTIEEQLGRSPDRADAVVNCLAAVPHIGADLSQWLDMGAF